ncbi:MAG: hypothetical protein DRQ63_09700 [Gammaproteobacteria bacterium]|nr:MAG: hypothetical protein DRQ63_09700 [Gammaproteobacteria bacterium]
MIDLHFAEILVGLFLAGRFLKLAGLGLVRYDGGRKLVFIKVITLRYADRYLDIVAIERGQNGFKSFIDRQEIGVGATEGAK